MLSKVKNSLAYRLPQLYKVLLSFKSISKISAKAQSGDVIITMTGKKLIGMTRLSILSIARSWNYMPKLIVVSDGTISAKEIARHLGFWPGELMVSDWNDTESYHTGKNRSALVRFADKHVLGKKLAVILHHSELQPVIWIDSDILFFNNFDISFPAQNESYFGGSEEGYSVYDDRVLSFFDHDLYKLFRFSSGLLAAFGKDVYEMYQMETLLNKLIDYDHYFTEQTIFAHLASKSLGILWPMDLIKNYAYDNQDIRPTKTDEVVARHYTANVRHIFWRDAFFKL